MVGVVVSRPDFKDAIWFGVRVCRWGDAVFHGLGGFVTLLWPGMDLNWMDASLAVFMVCALLALLVKRLRDAGLSASWLWLNVLPGGGTLLLLCVVLIRGTMPASASQTGISASSVSQSSALSTRDATTDALQQRRV
ncbi:hypothetical protein PCI56_25595 [Plesiomonas shigelloides subsp. oncorhynchi]|nr:hypothetical protein [Plesiomonas shigelloides]